MLDRPLGGASLRTPMEYDDYLALGETKHHEYYDGLCVVNPPSRSHARAQVQFVDLLCPLCPETHEVLTGWGWHIGPELDFDPDIMVVDRSSPDEDVLRNPPPLLSSRSPPLPLATSTSARSAGPTPPAAPGGIGSSTSSAARPSC